MFYGFLLYNIAKFYYESKLDFQFKNTVFILIESSKKEKDLKYMVAENKDVILFMS